MNRYEGVRFSDGSVALRRIDPDPCERATRTFESVHECNEELGRHEVVRWLVDAWPHRESLSSSKRYEPTEETDEP